MVQAGQVFHRNAQFLEQLVGQLSLQFHEVGILHIIGFLVGLTVQIDDTVLDLECLSRQSHATFHVVFPTVGRTGIHGTVFRLVVTDILTAHVIQLLIVVPLLLGIERIHLRLVLHQLFSEGIAHQIVVGCLITRIGADGITGRIVEHHDIIEFHLA